MDQPVRPLPKVSAVTLPQAAGSRRGPVDRTGVVVAELAQLAVARVVGAHDKTARKAVRGFAAAAVVAHAADPRPRFAFQRARDRRRPPRRRFVAVGLLPDLHRVAHRRTAPAQQAVELARAVGWVIAPLVDQHLVRHAR